MAIRRIMEIGDEKLRKTCKRVEKFDLRLRLLLKDLADTMYRAEGVGLAAPQVGILRRAAVVDVGEGLVELVNPEIISMEGEQSDVEGCLSVPGRRAMVTRPLRVTVRAQDSKGEAIEMTAEGFLARAFCHEMDHLDGVLYVDKMDREVFEDEEIAEDGETASDAKPAVGNGKTASIAETAAVDKEERP